MALNAYYADAPDGSRVTRGSVVMWNSGAAAIGIQEVQVYLLYANSDNPYAVTASCPDSILPARPSDGQSGAWPGAVEKGARAAAPRGPPAQWT